jgi:hypothetical protein
VEVLNCLLLSLFLSVYPPFDFLISWLSTFISSYFNFIFSFALPVFRHFPSLFLLLQFLAEMTNRSLLGHVGTCTFGSTGFERLD